MIPYIDSSELRSLRETLGEIIIDVIAPRAGEVDEKALWPEHSFRALGAAGLLGLHVPVELGGKGQGMTALAMMTEMIGEHCPSSAMCFGMHCVGTAVIAAKPTSEQAKKYLEPIAKGEHITTLALSEAGTGAHFYMPSVQLRHEEGGFLVEGDKSFVTSAGHCDSYVVSTQAEEATGVAEFSCIVVDSDLPGIELKKEWHGLGMRGNSSRGVGFRGTEVPHESLLGEEGEQIWYIFEVIAPYFLIAMAGTYIGIARGALGHAIRHVKNRTHTHSGRSLGDLELIQNRIAVMWADVEKTRLLMYHAAKLGDLGDPDALMPLLTSKAEVAETATRVVNDCMTMMGGISYGENGIMSRYLRDVRAAHVMSPTTDLLRLWGGRVVLGQPLF